MAAFRRLLGPVPLPPDEILDQYAEYLDALPLMEATRRQYFQNTVMALSYGFSRPEQAERDTVPGWSTREHQRARMGLSLWQEFLSAVPAAVLEAVPA